MQVTWPHLTKREGRCNRTMCQEGETAGISVNSICDNTRTKSCTVKGRIIKVLNDGGEQKDD